eukprot:scaffold134514_cov20-Tisochrysis_lutea.AAC.2
MTPGHFVTPLDTPSHSLSLVASRRLHSHDTGTLCDTILYQVTPCRQLASRRLQSQDTWTIPTPLLTKSFLMGY